MITFGGPGDCLQPPGFPGIYFHNLGMSHDIPPICQDLLLGSRFLYRQKIHQTGGFPVPGVVHLVIQLIQTANLQQSRVQFARTAHRLHLTALYTVHSLPDTAGAGRRKISPARPGLYSCVSPCLPILLLLPYSFVLLSWACAPVFSCWKAFMVAGLHILDDFYRRFTWTSCSE